MEIRIVLPRLRWILFVAIVGGLLSSGIVSVKWPMRAALLPAQGGGDPTVIASARTEVDRERIRQAVLEKREEILRYQLHLLEEAETADASIDTRTRVQVARDNLLAIINERVVSEHLLLQSLEALWEAEGTVSTREYIATSTRLLWPIAPRKGISATFEDAAYQKRFGFAHHAIDIPTPSGTVIQAPADGIVTTVSMNGMGYSYVVIRHDGGMETIYGHVRRPLVAQGQSVRAGDAVAETGGMPGEPGTGPYSTGPHLHFAVRIGGVLVDPLLYLVQ